MPEAGAGDGEGPGVTPGPEPYVRLPQGLRSPREEARVVFDGVAGLYDRARPGYPSETLTALVDRCHLDAATRILEVGCGTGQLTRSLAPLGPAIRCLEPGPALAALARRALAGYPTVEVVVSTFEDAAEDPASYDAVVSATAFHWIDPGVAFPKAARLLRPGGFLALLTNSHAAGGTQMTVAPEIDALHRSVAPELGEWRFPAGGEIERAARRERDIAAVWQAIERRFEPAPSLGDLFGPPEVHVTSWVATYDRDGYLDMLRTQSSYALLAPARLEELMQGIGDLVDRRLGGTVTKEYLTVLVTARRR